MRKLIVIVFDKNGQCFYYNDPEKVVVFQEGFVIFTKTGKMEKFLFKDLQGTENFGIFYSNDTLLNNIVREKYEEWKQRQKQK